MNPTTVRVALARPLPEPLTYGVPAHLGPVGVGHVVLVPLGARGETGYVVGLGGEAGLDPAKIKPISRVLDPVPAFDAAQLGFFEWIASYYLAPLGQVIATALPSELKARVVGALHPTDAGVDALTAKELSGSAVQVLREIVSRPGLTRRGLLRRLGDELDAKEAERGLDALLRRELVEVRDREIGETRGRVKVVELVGALDAALTTVPAASRRMRSVLAALADAGGSADLPELLADQGGSARDAVTRLEELGLVAIRDRERRDPLDEAPPVGAVLPPELNVHQLAALIGLTRPDAHGAHLLLGVTGSGKTEVFLGAARAALDRGKQVLVLVPEIGLTPQLVGRFRARFGDAVAVLHSGLTGGERLAQWRRIRAGEASVAVGARSALFAPFQALGLIVVDEEHDDSYKQDEGVPYNARDCAVVLGSLRGCPVVLASATPSLESWQNAATGRYHLLRLPERATPRPVPEVELIDLNEVQVEEGQPRPLLAPEVERELRETFDRGGQAIVLYNRRGFATMVECSSCGATYECPNCGITMTLHKRAWRVVCHYCGLKRHYSEQCPVCHASTLDEQGKGTERIEADLRALFPDVPMARMDADTTSGRGAHERILTAFRERKTQLLIGTQIVAKGHDFPDVQTGVVISADRGFRMPDFRAAERTWALLVQLAGRAGRGHHPGRVLVQTWSPEHYALKHLDDPDKFYAAELRIRATMRYPPFTRLCLVRLDGVDRNAVQAAAESLAEDLRRAARATGGLDLLGPAPAALPRLVGRWRFQLVIRGTDPKTWRAFLAAHQPRIRLAGQKGVRVAVDVDPRHLM